jgi:uncharacterized surface protein with fasciclin (FAS1) repeats
MNIKLFLSLLVFTVLSSSAMAQCNSHHKKSHHKNVKSAYHERNDIIDIASGNDQFSTLTTAVKVAGLVSTLQSEGPFTVFAPTNAAFAKLAKGTVESLLKPAAKEQLIKILTYHVVSGTFNAKDVINAINASGGKFTIETVSGDELTATLSGQNVILTDENGGVSAVTATDIEASNGVVHVIDSVVLPK